MKKRIFLIFLIVFSVFTINIISSIGVYPPTDENVKLYYHFNNQSEYGENDTHIYDFSGNGNNGTVVGATWNSTGGFLGDGAFEFAGGETNQYISIGKINFSTNDFAFSFWMKSGSGNVNKYILGNGEGGAYCRENGQGNLQCFISNSTTKVPSTMTCNFDINTWNYFEVVYNRDENISVYKNKILCATSNISIYENLELNSTHDFVLGIWRDKSYGEWNGSLDDFIIYNIAINQTQINSNYNNYFDQNIIFTNPTFNNNTETGNSTFLINSTIITPDAEEIILNINSYTENILDNNVEMYINFDNNTNIGDSSTSAKDISHNNLIVTLNENVTYIDGYNGKAVYFNNTNSTQSTAYGNIEHIDNNGSQPFTICTRFKYDSDQIIESGYTANLFKSPFGDTTGTPTGSMYFNTAAGFRMNFENETGADFPADTPAYTQPNKWYHLCGKWNGTANIVYLDGIAGTPVNTVGNMAIGSGDMYLGGGKFKGAIDYIKIWNYSLSDDEINEDYSTNLYKINSSAYQIYKEKHLTEGNYSYNISVKDSGSRINYSENRNVQIVPENYYLTSNNGRINLTYRITPNFNIYGNLEVGKRNVAILNSIYMNVSTEENNYLFRPSTGGLSIILNNTYYYYYSGAGIDFTYDIKYNDSNKIVVLYNFSDSTGFSSAYNVTYLLNNLSLEVNVAGIDTNAYQLGWDDTGGEQYKDEVPPTFNFNGFFGNIFLKNNIFFSIFPDVKTSMANDIRTDSDPVLWKGNSSDYSVFLRYFPKLDGSRNKMNETLSFVVSDDIDDIFNAITSFEAYQVAPYKDAWDNSTIIASVLYSTFSEVSSMANIWDNYGLRDIIFWYRSGYSEGHPTYVPLSEGYGGNAGFNETNINLSSYGYSGILYVDYWDMYDSSSYYNESEIVINRTGGWTTAWATSFAATRPYQYWMILQQEPVIKSLGVTGSYYDVFTAYLPWSRVDFNQSKVGVYSEYDEYNGSAHFNYLWSVNHSETMHSIHSAPIMSETQIIPYLGMVDNVYGYMSTLATHAPWIPNLEMSIQKYVSVSSYLWSDARYPGTPDYNTLRTHVIDNVLHRRIGSIYKDDTFSWTDKNRVDYYYILNAVQREQQSKNISTITYWNTTDWITLSELLVQDDSSWTKTKNPIVRKTYVNSNLTDYVNKANYTINITYNEINYTLYPNRSIVFNNDTSLFQYVGIINETNLTIVESDDYMYLESKDKNYSHQFIEGLGDYYYISELNFDNYKRDSKRLEKITSFDMELGKTYQGYRLGSLYNIKLNSSDGKTKLYNNNSREMDDLILGSKLYSMNNTMEDNVNVSIINRNKALVYNTNLSIYGSPIISNNNGDINITLASGNSSYILNNYNLTIGQTQRENDPIYNATKKLVNNTLQEGITFQVYGGEPNISNGYFTGGTYISESEFTIPQNSHGVLN